MLLHKWFQRRARIAEFGFKPALKTAFGDHYLLCVLAVALEVPSLAPGGPLDSGKWIDGTGIRVPDRGTGARRPYHMETDRRVARWERRCDVTTSSIRRCIRTLQRWVNAGSWTHELPGHQLAAGKPFFRASNIRDTVTVTVVPPGYIWKPESVRANLKASFAKQWVLLVYGPGYKGRNTYLTGRTLTELRAAWVAYCLTGEGEGPYVP